MRIVEIKGLVRKFEGLVAVDKIDLAIEEGEIFGLLGPNGAGKSTTIQMICGLLHPDQGEVKVLGKNVGGHSGFTKQNIGIVPQDLAIYEDLTASENVRFFAGLYGLRGRELQARVDEALQFVGLAEHAKNNPSQYSGGMKRRLNIACALAHHPKVIIMDEPTVGIDPQSRKHILQSVQRLKETGCTIIYTSHYMEEVEELCSRIAIMDHGKIIAEGTKEELKAIISNTDSVWITVNAIEQNAKEDLLKLNGVLNVEIDQNVVKINSVNDVNNLDPIIQFFTTRRIRIKKVESKMPDLETVFLTLTGRNLRDEKEGAS